MAASAYIVCWVEQRNLQNGGTDMIDHYEVFNDGLTTEENRVKAKAKYDELVEDEKKVLPKNATGSTVWSANMCKVIKSTDY